MKITVKRTKREKKNPISLGRKVSLLADDGTIIKNILIHQWNTYYNGTYEPAKITIEGIILNENN